MIHHLNEVSLQVSLDMNKFVKKIKIITNKVQNSVKITVNQNVIETE